MMNHYNQARKKICISDPACVSCLHSDVHTSCNPYPCNECSELPQDKTTDGRTFEGGAYRDSDENKLDFTGGLSPEVDKSYLEYLNSTRLQSNGEMRSFDNWKSGIPILEYLKSGDRHHRDVWTHLRGTIGPKPEQSLKDCIHAVLFNYKGMLHEVLREEEKNRQTE